MKYKLSEIATMMGQPLHLIRQIEVDEEIRAAAQDPPSAADSPARSPTMLCRHYNDTQTCSACAEIGMLNATVESLKDALRTWSKIQWVSIDSAPKDGTPILVWDGYNQTVARWGHDDLWDNEPKMWIYGECFGEYNVYNTIYSPSHWSPLPEAPSGSEVPTPLSPVDSRLEEENPHPDEYYAYNRRPLDSDLID